MTTIAYRDGILVADTAVTDRGCYVGETVKAWRNSRGQIAAVAGCLGDLAAFREWFMAGPDGEPPDFKVDDSEAMVIDTDGSVSWFGEKRRSVPMAGQFFAIGSGFRVAMGALAAGANAERAIEIAADLDIATRRPLTILRLHEADAAPEDFDHRAEARVLVFGGNR